MLQKCIPKNGIWVEVISILVHRSYSNSIAHVHVYVFIYFQSISWIVKYLTTVPNSTGKTTQRSNTVCFNMCSS